MQIGIIKDILNLKENEGYNILNIGVKKDENFSLIVDGDVNFTGIYEEYLDDILSINFNLFSLYKEEILKGLENTKDLDICTTMSIFVIADNQGNTVSIHIPCVNIYEKQENELVDSIMLIQSKLDRKLNFILDNFVDKEDDIKEFQLVFKKDCTGQLKYSSFNRLCDRSISQQKQEIQELLSSDFEDKLIEKATSLGYDLSKIEKREIVFAFNTDMKNVLDLKIGTY